jgi:DNA-binding transcriptional ArsR family regulator
MLRNVSLEKDLSDPKLLRALAHPVRLRILAYLRSRESATATEVAEQIEESVASASYHLRILAKYGFIAPAERRGREKPWKAVQVSTALTTSELSPANKARANAMARAGRQSFFEQLERWADQTDSNPREWQNAAFGIGYGMRLTAKELTAMRKELQKVLDRYHAKSRKRPNVAPIVFQAWGFPAPDSDELRGDKS